MTQEHLNAELPALEAIALSDVRKPNVAMSVYLLESNRIMVYLTEKPDVRRALLSAGLKMGEELLTEDNLLPMLTSRLGAARYAQASWDAVRSTRKPEEVRAQEDAAYDLRGDLVAASRWNLRHDRIAQGTLNAIQEGDGIADLITDLDALAVLILNNQAAFTHDAHFDAQASAVHAQEVAQALRAVEAERSGEGREDALQLRDRAWTHLEVLMAELRAAGRYVFRKDPDRLIHFQRLTTRRASTGASPEPVTS